MESSQILSCFYSIVLKTFWLLSSVFNSRVGSLEINFVIFLVLKLPIFMWLLCTLLFVSYMTLQVKQSFTFTRSQI
jgi:hypothetical protein